MRRLTLVVALSLLSAPDPIAAAGGPRLLIATVDDSGGGCDGRRVQHLLSYTIDGDVPTTPDTLVSDPGSQLRFSSPSSRVFDDRYVVTGLGDVFDLDAGAFIDPGNSVPPSPADRLPGVLSPDGTMSVALSGPTGDPHELRLHSLDGEATLLGSGFRLELSALSSAMGVPAPLFWLDDRRILTQRSNGEIVMVTTDGVVDPVVSIDLSTGRQSVGGPDHGALSAEIMRDAEDRIVYTIGLPSRIGRRAFVVDVDGKTYREPEVVWLPVGSEFDATLATNAEGRRAIRHRGREIGQTRCEMADCRVTDGHIALVARAGERGTDRRVRVWTERTGQWIEIDFESPVWITHSAVVGWVVREDGR